MRPLALAALLLGCSATVNAPADAGGRTDAPTTDNPTTDTPTTDNPTTDNPTTDNPTTDTGPAIRCEGVTSVFPEFDARCGADADCALGVHQTNCCGDRAAVGIRRDERARFDAAEAVCRPMYPRCGCPTRGTLADDGRWSFDDGALRVACRGGRCVTSVADAPDCPGVTCGPGQLCARGCCGVPGCTPPPNRCVTIPPACEGRPRCECLGPSACPAGSCVGAEGTAVICLCA